MQKKLKVLNLYAGIGGNRKLWKDVDVTAVEINPEIAKIYQGFFPDDTVIVCDAHQFLLDHYDDGWDFIWSSPPCPTHSKIRNIAGVGRGQNKPVYPDVTLYQEIIFLNQITHSNGCKFKGKWVVENVISYYEPLIKPIEIQRHYFWSNFHIARKEFDCDRIHHCSIPVKQKELGVDLSKYNLDIRKDKILRNCVNPKLGLHVFKCANYNVQINLKEIQK